MEPRCPRNLSISRSRMSKRQLQDGLFDGEFPNSFFSDPKAKKKKKKTPRIAKESVQIAYLHSIWIVSRLNGRPDQALYLLLMSTTAILSLSWHLVR